MVDRNKWSSEHIITALSWSVFKYFLKVCDTAVNTNSAIYKFITMTKQKGFFLSACCLGWIRDHG